MLIVIYIWTTCDYIWVGYHIRDIIKIEKKLGNLLYAELGKDAFLCTLEIHFAECSIFAECCGKSTRQRGRVCWVLLPRHSAKGQALPSGLTTTLGKREGFANCFAVMALDKALSPSVGCLYIFIFIESLLSTRQKHCRVPDRKHSANSSLSSSWLLCDVCRRRHMANLCPVFTNNRIVYLCLYKLL